MSDRDHAMTIRLPAGLYAGLKAEADRHERTVAGLLRLLARQHLEGLEGHAFHDLKQK